AANRAQLANSAIAALKSAQEEVAGPGKQASGLANTPEIVSQSSIQVTVSKQQKDRGWRSGRDSNPRYGFSTVQRFSKPPPSASRPPLPIDQRNRLPAPPMLAARTQSGIDNKSRLARQYEL